MSGPTSIGKTSLSIQLSEVLNGEIISADSAQIFKYMNIGTAKANSEDLQRIKHHMIDIVVPSMDFTVNQWNDGAKYAANDIITRKKVPIVTGGGGLYLRWFLYGKPSTAPAQSVNGANLFNKLCKEGWDKG